MEKLRLLILFGGRSSEYKVSLISASSIIKNADKDKYDIVTVGITKKGDWFYYDGEPEKIRDGSWCEDDEALSPCALSPSVSDQSLLVFDSRNRVEKFGIDVIFPVMHGAYSEDGTLQGLLQMTAIPFVGCKCLTSAVGMDKAFTKRMLNSVGIPQAKAEVVLADELSDENSVIARCETLSSYPLFVKPANAGSSVGASKASSREELIPAIRAAAEHDSKIIVEEFIVGKECEVAVLGSRKYITSTVGQIVPTVEFYDYDAKYAADSETTYNIPAAIKPETRALIKDTAVKIATTLGVDGLSRVDFFVTGEGDTERIIFNEINTLPGFTEISMYPKLFMHDGFTYSGLIDRLVDLALGKDELN